MYKFRDLNLMYRFKLRNYTKYVTYYAQKILGKL